jgi:hypothetical protein
VTSVCLPWPSRVCAGSTAGVDVLQVKTSGWVSRSGVGYGVVAIVGSAQYGEPEVQVCARRVLKREVEQTNTRKTSQYYKTDEFDMISIPHLT